MKIYWLLGRKSGLKINKRKCEAELKENVKKVKTFGGYIPKNDQI